jgi:hypothetical protein
VLALAGSMTLVDAACGLLFVSEARSALTAPTRALMNELKSKGRAIECVFVEDLGQWLAPTDCAALLSSLAQRLNSEPHTRGFTGCSAAIEAAAKILSAAVSVVEDIGGDDSGSDGGNAADSEGYHSASNAHFSGSDAEGEREDNGEDHADADAELDGSQDLDFSNALR